MKKFSKIEILKNVGSSWFALGINVLVGIFISRYILHRLGNEASTRRAWQVREISRTMLDEAEAVELVETYQQQG